MVFVDRCGIRYEHDVTGEGSLGGETGNAVEGSVDDACLAKEASVPHCEALKVCADLTMVSAGLKTPERPEVRPERKASGLDRDPIRAQHGCRAQLLEAVEQE